MCLCSDALSMGVLDSEDAGSDIVRGNSSLA